MRLLMILVTFVAFPVHAEEWTYHTDTDDFTDAVSTRASSAIFRGEPQRHAVLSVGCSKGVVSSWVNTGYFNPSGEATQLDVRFDDDKSRRIWINEWRGTGGFSIDFNMAFGRFMNKKSFIRSLMEKQRLRILTYYYSHGSAVFDFSLAGANIAIQKVLDDCNYSVVKK